MLRGLIRWLRRMLFAVAVLVAVLFVAGPYERVELEAGFDPDRLSAGIDRYLGNQEARLDDIRPGNEKRVVWYGLEEVPTAPSVVYFHGFSASSGDMRPVPERIAQALGANLVLTRLRGHGRDGAALADATAGDWMRDAAEALAVARAAGHEVVVIATSTGGTIAAVAAHDPALMRGVKGMVFVSPNFGVNDPLAPLLTFPAARYWLPLIPTRSLKPRNALQARNWTTEYPISALLPMAALVRHARRLDYGQIGLPALFYYSDEDQVVRAAETDRIAAEWGGPVTRARPVPGAGMDINAHMIAGDILSPANTDEAVKVILDWVHGLE